MRSFAKLRKYQGNQNFFPLTNMKFSIKFQRLKGSVLMKIDYYGIKLLLHTIPPQLQEFPTFAPMKVNELRIAQAENVSSGKSLLDGEKVT